MLTRGIFRSIAKHLSSHQLPNIKVSPPLPLHFTDRNLVIHPRQELPSQISCPVEIIPAETQFKITPNLPIHTRLDQLPPPVEKKTQRQVAKKLKTSVKKLELILWNVRGKQVDDAIDLMMSTKKKVAVFIKKTIEGAIRHGELQQDMDRNFLFVKHAMTGRNKHLPHIRYHAKGRFGKGKRRRSQLTIILEERTPEEVYYKMMEGKVPVSWAQELRNELLTSNADYSTVQNLQRYLTSRGRHQQRAMLKRKVFLKRQELLSQGIVYSDEKIKQQILEEGAKEFAENYYKVKNEESEKRLAERFELFKRNEGL